MTSKQEVSLERGRSRAQTEPNGGLVQQILLDFVAHVAQISGGNAQANAVNSTDLVWSRAGSGPGGWWFKSTRPDHFNPPKNQAARVAIGESATGSLRYRDRCSIVRKVLDGQLQQLTETKASRCYQEKQHALCPLALTIMSGTCSAVNDGLCWFFTSERSMNSWFHLRG